MSAELEDALKSIDSSSANIAVKALFGESGSLPPRSVLESKLDREHVANEYQGLNTLAIQVSSRVGREGAALEQHHSFEEVFRMGVQALLLNLVFLAESETPDLELQSRQ